VEKTILTNLCSCRIYKKKGWWWWHAKTKCM